jgi:hypothetical protein
MHLHLLRYIHIQKCILKLIGTCNFVALGIVNNKTKWNCSLGIGLTTIYKLVLIVELYKYIKSINLVLSKSFVKLFECYNLVFVDYNVLY